MQEKEEEGGRAANVAGTEGQRVCILYVWWLHKVCALVIWGRSAHVVTPRAHWTRA
jgi:hypothetical protein